MSDVFGARSGGGLGDLFSDLFGTATSNTGRRRSNAAGPVKGQDASAEITLDFDEAVRGTTLPLQLSSAGTCRTCHGSGARPGTSTHTCPNCGGSGMVNLNQGGFGFSEPCRECRGTGQIIETPCPDCHGTGSTVQTRTITVRVPTGVKDGAKLRIPGKGSAGTRGGPAGDLYVTVRVRPHELFGRNGNDLTLTVPISFTEAALGTTLRVPTLDGAVSVKVAPGTPSGRTMRVRGRGVAAKSKTGDLLVTVEVDVPTALTDESREALEKYAATQHTDPRPKITAALARGGDRHAPA
jgi:molecular chaperone DnaJ